MGRDAAGCTRLRGRRVCTVNASAPTGRAFGGWDREFDGWGRRAQRWWTRGMYLQSFEHGIARTLASAGHGGGEDERSYLASLGRHCTGLLGRRFATASVGLPRVLEAVPVCCGADGGPGSGRKRCVRTGGDELSGMNWLVQHKGGNWLDASPSLASPRPEVFIRTSHSTACRRGLSITNQIL